MSEILATDQNTNLDTQPVSSPSFIHTADLFATVTPWELILEPHGWVPIRRNKSDHLHWRRPGKSTGASATTNYAGTDLLHVFSANAYPFDVGGVYSKFSAYALLNFEGDSIAATSALVEQGFTCRNIGPRQSH